MVLFISDRDRRLIRILSLTAAALRQAMGIPDPDLGDVFEEIEPECDESTNMVLDHDIE